MSIYAFFDARYDQGVKVGRGHAAAYITDAQAWSPASIRCAGVWTVDTPEKNAESNLHEQLALKFDALVRPSPETPHNGIEWLDIPPSEAVALVEAELTAAEHLFLREDVVEPKGNRRDSLASSPTYKGRLVIWVMEECLTGLVKVYPCSEWKSPREPRKRYSRNGFTPVAAFTYADKVSLANNEAIYEVQEATIRHFGSAKGKERSGWLNSDAGVTEVVRHINDTIPSLVVKVDDIESEAGRPLGVRRSYTGRGSQIDQKEIESCFAEV